MLNKPKISVIMSVYNGEKYLKEAIDSILNQTFADFEFIIVNDGSTDSSLAIMQGYHDERIRVIDNGDNIGLTKSLNKAIKQALGEYIARQDADDVSLPNRFEEQIKYLGEYPEVALLGTSVYRIDEHEKVLGVILPSTKPGKSLFKLNQFSHGSIMFRKVVFDRLGGYNELFKYAQDYEFWLRISRHYQVRNLKQLLYKLRFHRESIGATRREESLLYHLLATRMATSELNEAMLEAIRDKKLSNVYSYLNRSERAFFHKEMAAMYMSINDVPAAKKQYKRAFMLNPFDVYNDINLILSHFGGSAWSWAHQIYEFIIYRLLHN